MDLLDFIIKAKLAGYATGGEGPEISFENGYKGFQLDESGYSYLDKYTGFNPFTGTETIFDLEKEEPIWVMNYFGKSYAPVDRTSELYRFLKEAMQKISPNYPFRGPQSINQVPWQYRNHQNGNLSHFHGIEEILLDGKKVYELFYHGGLLQPWK